MRAKTEDWPAGLETPGGIRGGPAAVGDAQDTRNGDAKEGSAKEMLPGGVVQHGATASSSKPHPVPHTAAVANGHRYEHRVFGGTPVSIVCLLASEGFTGTITSKNLWRPSQI